MFRIVLLVLFTISLSATAQVGSMPIESIIGLDDNEICGENNVECVDVYIYEGLSFYEEIKNTKKDSFYGPQDVQWSITIDAYGNSASHYVNGNSMFKKLKEEKVYEVRINHFMVETFRGYIDTVGSYRRAMQVYNKIKKSENIVSAFDSCVLKYNTQELAPISGDLGWQRMGDIPLFEDACFTAHKGDLLFVKSMYGYHIIYVTEEKRLIKDSERMLVRVYFYESEDENTLEYESEQEERLL